MTRINIMKRILITAAAIIAAALSANAQQVDTIKISNITTTHIRFSSEIKYVDLSNKVLAAKIVEGSRDIIALKAKEPFDFITTMSCLEANGAMHTYLVRFEEYPKQLVIEAGKSVKSEETATPAAPAIQNRNTALSQEHPRNGANRPEHTMQNGLLLRQNLRPPGPGLPRLPLRIQRHPKLRHNLQREGYQQISAAPIATLTFSFSPSSFSPAVMLG